MNKVFKSVWSEALGAWVAASELCRGRGKGGGKVARSIAAAALVLAAGSVMASTTSGNGATTVGPNDNALGDGSYANGAAGADSTAIGHNVKTNAGNAFSIGSIIANDAASSIVMGNGGTNAVSMDATSSNTVFFAPNGGSVTNSANSFVFNPYGTTGTTGSSDSVNISGTVTNAANAVALGSKSSVSAANAVALGSNSVADQVDTVSVGSATYQRKITNVKAGDISTSSTDAVNGSQLAATNNAVADTVKYDSPAHDSVKLGNVGTPVKVTNVANGAVNTTSTDAVNGSQLAATDAAVANAVMYDSTTKDTVTLNKGSTTAVKVTNVANGAVNTTSTDAVNGSQLAATDAAVANAVMYDSTTKDTVTLNKGSTTAVKVTNVANGAVNTTSTDAVNGSQLAATNASIEDVVKYDSPTHDRVKLGNVGTPVTVTNVKAGDVSASSTDAVNGSQLAATNANVANAVQYDSAAHDQVTFNPGGTPTKLTNVAAGTLSATSTDAVNGAQLFGVKTQVDNNTTDIRNINSTINNITNGTVGIVTQDAATGNISVAGDTGGNLVNFAGTGGARQITGVKDGGVSATSTDAINGSQLYNTAASTAAALGGGAGVDENGGITAPTYTVGGTDVHDVGTAISNLDARTAQNTTDITNIGTATKNAVTYDSDSHNKVTLGGTAAADGTEENAVQLTNVKAGELSDTSTDAVNGAQLNATNARVDTFENTINNISVTGSPYVAINSSVATSPTPTATGTDAVAIGANAQASGNNSVALGANSVANESNTASVGSVGNERRVTNVAPGQSGTDAANMNQVNALRNEVGQNMTALQRSAYGGVASAMAMPSLSPREPGKTMVAVGVANYKGYGAVGAGATYRSRDGAWLINGALSVTPHGDTGARAQVGYEF
jgi:autotransporter adhesin